MYKEMGIWYIGHEILTKLPAKNHEEPEQSEEFRNSWSFAHYGTDHLGGRLKPCFGHFLSMKHSNGSKYGGIVCWAL